MANSLGALVVSLGLDSAEFTRGLSKSEYESKRAMESIKARAASVTDAMARIGVGIGFGAIVAGFNNIVDSAAKLDDMAEKTGASVEELSKLEQVIRIGGHSAEVAESALVRLSKAIHASDDEAKGAGKALAALGLSQDALRGKDTAEALRIVAVELNKYADGSGKTALAIDLLGKSGAQALPFLKDLATEQGIATRVTAEQAAAAEELQKNIRRLTNDMSAARQALVLGLVPGISDWVAANREALRIGGSTTEMLRLFVFNMEAMTTEKPGEQIRRLTGELERLRGVMAGSWWKQSGIDFFGGEQSIKDKEKQIEFLKFLQRQEALAIRGGDTRGEMQRFGLPGAKQALDYQSTGAAGKAGKEVDIWLLQHMARIKQQDEIESAAEKASQALEKEAQRWRDLADPIEPLRRDLAQLNDLYEQGRIGFETWAGGAFDVQEKIDAALNKTDIALKSQADRWRDLIDPMRQVEREHAEITKLVATGWLTDAEGNLAKLDPAIRALLQPLDNLHNKLQKAWEAGLIETPQMESALKRLADDHQAASDEITEFWREAARNMQTSMSDFFFDAMQGKLDGLGTRFKSTIDRMVANNLAGQANTALFGKDFEKGGNIGGLIGKGLDWLKGTQAPAPVVEAIPKLVTDVAGAGQEAASALAFSTAITTSGAAFSAEVVGAGAALVSETSAAGALLVTELTTAAAVFAAEIAAAGATFAAEVAVAGAGSAVSSGAGALALLGSFDTGTPWVPRTGPYLLHKGERVVTEAENLRGMRALAPISRAAEMPRMPDQHFHFHGDQPDRRTMSQVGAQAFEGASRAFRRNR